MKYYDSNGNIHDNIFSLIWHSITNQPREPDKKIEHMEVKTYEITTPKSASVKDIEIDFDNKKISLVDESGKTITESEIDPILNKENFNKINIASTDSILNSDNIDKLLSSERLIGTIDRLQSNDFKHPIIDGDKSTSIFTGMDIKSLKESILKIIKTAIPALVKVIINIFKKRVIK